MIEKTISGLKILRGSKILEQLQAPEADQVALMTEFAAVYLADQETLKKSRQIPEILDPLRAQVEDMTPEELAEIFSFFTVKCGAFTASIFSVDPAKIAAAVKAKKK